MLVLDGQVNLAESDEIYTKQIVNSDDLGKCCVFPFAGVSKLISFVFMFYYRHRRKIRLIEGNANVVI
jgi:hypothetical protein